jgi:hypothetical protein
MKAGTMVDSNQNKLKKLLKFVTSEGRILPSTNLWNQLWEMLPNRKRLPNGGWEPPLPLILAAWHTTSHLSKINRLREHLEYANQNHVLDEVDKFLRSLELENWLVIPNEAGGRGGIL